MGSFTKVRDAVETAASLGGNYLLPGSSLVSSHLVSKGSQSQLNSTIGKIAQAATGLTGSGVGSSFTGIPSASSIGAGYTNAANGVGSLLGNPTLGTDISNGIGNATKSFSSLFGNGASAPLSAADNSFLSSAKSSSQGFSPGETALLSNASAGLSGAGGGSSGLSSALAGGIGGGGSSYGNLAAVAGAANSLYANDQAQKDLLKAQDTALSALQPYQATGAAANSRLSDLLGTSGNTSASAYGTLGQPFNPGDLTQDPGYKFQLDQGNQALARKQAASGNYFSGAALKQAQDYGQGLADTTYNNAYSRYLQQQQQQYGMLAGQGGQGANVAGTVGNIAQNTGNAQAGAGISSSNILNSTLSSLLSGSGAKRPVNVGGQVIYV